MMQKDLLDWERRPRSSPPCIRRSSSHVGDNTPVSKRTLKSRMRRRRAEVDMADKKLTDTLKGPFLKKKGLDSTKGDSSELAGTFWRRGTVSRRIFPEIVVPTACGLLRHTETGRSAALFTLRLGSSFSWLRRRISVVSRYFGCSLVFTNTTYRYQ